MWGAVTEEAVVYTAFSWLFWIVIIVALLFLIANIAVGVYGARQTYFTSMVLPTWAPSPAVLLIIDILAYIFVVYSIIKVWTCLSCAWKWGLGVTFAVVLILMLLSGIFFFVNMVRAAAITATILAVVLLIYMILLFFFDIVAGILVFLVFLLSIFFAVYAWDVVRLNGF
jgi:tryptophan-rich sensory protein